MAITAQSRSTWKSTSSHGPEEILEGYTDLIKNINTMYDLISFKLAKAFAVVGGDLLANAQPRVPWDTGALRKSGTVAIDLDNKRTIVGRGKLDGHILLNLGALRAPKANKAKTIDMEVSYYRMDGEEDVALITHETLNPYEKRHEITFAARKPGTGPKYLEIPWLEKRDIYIDFLRNAMSEKELSHDIELISKVKQKGRTGQYTVDLVELIHSKIERTGYRGDKI